MKYKLPLAVPAGKHIYITQPYGRTYLTNEPVGPNGEPHFHYGSDIALGTPEETYGAAIVCPFPSAVVEKSSFTTAMSDNFNCVQLDYVQPDGKKLSLLLGHISALETPTAYTEGQVVAYVGNAGNVSPKPDIAHPYNGAHLHMALHVDGVATDPALFFDLVNGYVGGDTGQERDMPPAIWAVEQLIKNLEGFTGHKIPWTPQPFPTS